MARQSNGNYIQPANTAAVSAQTISSTAFNTLITDIGTEITNSVDRGGRSAMQAALPMGAQKITGMADPTVATDGATKNYVDTTTAAFFSTGDVKLTIKTVADTGWVMFDDGTIGSAGSGASSRSNADTQALFTLIFNNISDTYAPILTSGGGATTRAGQTNAATAWAANCRISLTKTLGRALGIAGTGSGLTARTLGQTLGEETHLLTLGEIPTGITAAGTATSGGRTIPTGNIAVNSVNVVLTGGTSQALPYLDAVSGGAWAGVTSLNASVTSNNTSGGAHNNMQPTSFLNCMIKL